MANTVQMRINLYLKDTIAAERNFEKALRTFGSAGEQTAVQSLLSSASAKAKTQDERLETLLNSRGESPSEGKTILAEMLAFTPLSAQIGQGAEEKNTQHFDGHVCRSRCGDGYEVAMYESLAQAAQLAGDMRTEELAKQIQQQEKQTAEKVWAQVAPAAQRAMRSVPATA